MADYQQRAQSEQHIRLRHQLDSPLPIRLVHQHQHQVSEQHQQVALAEAVLEAWLNQHQRVLAAGLVPVRQL